MRSITRRVQLKKENIFIFLFTFLGYEKYRCKTSVICIQNIAPAAMQTIAQKQRAIVDLENNK